MLKNSFKSVQPLQKLWDFDKMVLCMISIAKLTQLKKKVSCVFKNGYGVSINHIGTIVKYLEFLFKFCDFA